MSYPDTPAPQPSPPQSEPEPQSEPQPQATTTKARSGYGLLATAILFAGLGGGLMAWHPWDKGPAPEPPKDPHHITIQKIGDQQEGGDSESIRPVYCMTNETGGLYCMVMPNQYTAIRE
jgi:hypothetical protein